MIKECNFKQIIDKYSICTLGTIIQIKDDIRYCPCDGEENCLIYLIYKKLYETI